MQAIAAHLGGNFAADRLSLLEVPFRSDQAEPMLVVPTAPMRTEIVQQRIMVDSGGRPAD